jgi:hypothetical protein
MVALVLWVNCGGLSAGGEAPATEVEQGGALETAHTFNPVADARVEADAPGTNFGGSSTLKVDASPLYETYLRFELAGLSGVVKRATLRLYATDATAHGPLIYRVDGAWDERTITYASRPAADSPVASGGAVSAGAWAEWDVTSAVAGNGTVSLAVRPSGSDGTVFYGRETSNTSLRPQLLVVIEPASGGTDGGTSGGGTDAGTPPPPPPPSNGGWTFYGADQGGPRQVYGVSADQGGNLWVAGGEEGLFVLEKGASRFRRFTMAEGLRPYGYMLDGSAPSGTKYLKVVSVAGGPAGTAFVGYEGKKPASGMPTCEDEWDQAYYAGRTPDASIYKSGDADRVTLSGSGIQVVHYDLSTGPDKVRDEPRGREKVCNIWRIAYDPKTNSVWFGGNHGFAWGRADFAGYSCHLTVDKKWDYGCAGVMEHVHPAINAWNSTQTRTVLLTDAYYGVSVASNGDVWFGGANRTTRFRYGTNGNSYWRAQTETEGRDYSWNRIDVWPDAVGEPNIPTREQRVDDHVSGLAVMRDQSVWVGSFSRGLALLDSSGRPQRYVSTQLVDGKGYVSAVAADPSDESVWAGTSWGGGLSRVRGSTVTHYGASVIGSSLAGMRVSDIQVDRWSSTRRVLVAFQGTDSRAGAIGIYTGP